MAIDVLLDLPASMFPERVAIGEGTEAITFAGLAERAASGGALIQEYGAEHVVFVGVNGPAFTLALFAAARAGAALTPLNYRLGDDQFRAQLARLEGALVVVDDGMAARIPEATPRITTTEFVARTAEPRMPAPVEDTGAPAVVLFTSGTTSAPKGVVLKHDHLTSYVLQTVELAAAGEDECALVSVPPYHVAGIASALSNTYAARRVAHLPNFTAEQWLETVRRRGVTGAMLVPTMLARIVESLGGAEAEVPTLRSLSYGGARLAPSVLEKALKAFPTTNFTNAYGLTETSSTIAVLGPEDHRTAFASHDPAVRARLASVGRPVPGIELLVRGDDGRPAPAGEVGDLYVRGPQVSGEYVGTGSVLDAEGWFSTRDRGRLDADGYLFIEGRSDDTIIRGGENIAPAEIEAVLLTHPAVADAAVIGLPDEQWGERLAAVVVAERGAVLDLDDLNAFARSRLRGSKTPETFAVWTELPYNPLGKLLRRDVLQRLTESPSE